MHLALVPRRRLGEREQAHAPATFAALELALAARQAAGFPTLPYDPEEGLPALGVAPAALEADALVAQIRAAAEALREHGGIIESLWIVGGPEVVPFASRPNPMADRDGPLFGDAPYALAGPEEPLAHWPVGRTPDARPGLLALQLSRNAVAHARGFRSPGAVLALSAARWAPVTGAVIAETPGVTLSLAPPLEASNPALHTLEGRQMIYCNLHGVRNGDSWYGQPAGDSELIPVLQPAAVATLNLDGVVMITQACFGARLAPVDAPLTLATALFAAGARGFYGALGLTYGAPDLPPGESDLLAAALLARLRAPGARLGPAFVAAQADMLREVFRSQGALHPDDVKTLLGFILYGDPLLPA